MADDSKTSNNNNNPKAPKEAKPKAEKAKVDISKLELPEYVAHRLKIWDEEKKRQEEARQGMF